MLFHRSSSWSCRAWEDNPLDWGKRDRPHFRHAVWQGASCEPAWREPHTGQGLRRIRLLCRTQGSFLGTTSGTASQTQGRHRAWHRECRKGLAEAAGLAQLCGFQRYLIDSSFLPLPPLPQSPHAFFMLTPPGQRLSAQEKKQKKPQNTTNRNQNLRLFLWSPEIVVV